MTTGNEPIAVIKPAGGTVPLVVSEFMINVSPEMYELSDIDRYIRERMGEAAEREAMENLARQFAIPAELMARGHYPGEPD